MIIDGSIKCQVKLKICSHNLLISFVFFADGDKEFLRVDDLCTAKFVDSKFVESNFKSAKHLPSEILPVGNELNDKISALLEINHPLVSIISSIPCLDILLLLFIEFLLISLGYNL